MNASYFKLLKQLINKNEKLLPNKQIYIYKKKFYYLRKHKLENK